MRFTCIAQRYYYISLSSPCKVSGISCPQRPFGNAGLQYPQDLPSPQPVSTTQQPESNSPLLKFMTNERKFQFNVITDSVQKTAKYEVYLYCVALLLYQLVVSMQGVRHKLSLESACKQFDRGKLVRYPQRLFFTRSETLSCLKRM